MFEDQRQQHLTEAWYHQLSPRMSNMTPFKSPSENMWNVNITYAKRLSVYIVLVFGNIIKMTPAYISNIRRKTCGVEEMGDFEFICLPFTIPTFALII
jgi:hypothetical protein